MSRPSDAKPKNQVDSDLDMESAIASIGLDDDFNIPSSSQKQHRIPSYTSPSAGLYGKDIWGGASSTSSDPRQQPAGMGELLSPAAFIGKPGAGSGAATGASSIWSTPGKAMGADLTKPPPHHHQAFQSPVPSSLPQPGVGQMMSLEEIEKQMQSSAAAVPKPKVTGYGIVAASGVSMGPQFEDKQQLPPRAACCACGCLLEGDQGYGRQQQGPGSPQRRNYNNLMKKSEKDFILRVQMAQLQTDNPYLEDFYFQQYMLKKMSNDGTSIQGNVRLLLPQYDSSFAAKPYEPPKFEGATLVKSIQCPFVVPRTILETPTAERTTSSSKKSSFKNNTLK